jgi:hypothetical protein
MISQKGWKEALKYVGSNEIAVAGLKQAGITLLLGAILAALFKLLFSPAYKDFKSQKEGTSLIGRALMELAYRPFEASTDSLYGVFNLFWRLEDSSTPVLRVPEKFIKSAYKTLMGDKAFSSFMSENFAFARSFRETIKAAQTM